MILNEAIVKDAALEWFEELGYVIGQARTSRPASPRRRGIRSARRC